MIIFAALKELVEIHIQNAKKIYFQELRYDISGQIFIIGIKILSSESPNVILNPYDSLTRVEPITETQKESPSKYQLVQGDNNIFLIYDNKSRPFLLKIDVEIEIVGTSQLLQHLNVPMSNFTPFSSIINH